MNCNKAASLDGYVEYCQVDLRRVKRDDQTYIEVIGRNGEVVFSKPYTEKFRSLAFSIYMGLKYAANPTTEEISVTEK